MALLSQHPPDGWRIFDGVWGTDLKIDDGVPLGESLTAGTFLTFEPIAQTDPVSPTVKLVSDFFPAEEFVPFYVNVILRASRNNVGDNITVTYRVYNKDRSASYAPGPIINGVAPSIGQTKNDWFYVGGMYQEIIPTTATPIGWARIEIEKAHTDFRLDVDSVEITRAPSQRVFTVSTSPVTQTAKNLGKTNVLWNTASEAGFNEITIENTTDIIMRRAGSYVMAMDLGSSNFDNNENTEIRIVRGRASPGGGEIICRNATTSAVNNFGTILSTSGYIAIFSANDVVHAELYHSDGQTKDVDIGRLSIVRVLG